MKARAGHDFDYIAAIDKLGYVGPERVSEDEARRLRIREANRHWVRQINERARQR